MSKKYLTGIDALVNLPIIQKQRDEKNKLNTAGFISGYRGSPLSGLDQNLIKSEKELLSNKIFFKPGINEDLAATAVWGSQQVNIYEGALYDGVFGMWYGKGPGLDRSMDAIKHATAFGTSKFGGVIAVVGDDHASKSSTLPHQSEQTFISASMPVLNPSNVQEVIDFGILGWELSRYCGSWIGLKVVSDNMDSSASVDLDPDRLAIVIPNKEQDLNCVWPATPKEQEEKMKTLRLDAAKEFAIANKLNKVTVTCENSKLGIVTTGKAYEDVMQSLEDLGIEAGVSVYKVGMPWPLTDDILDFVSNIKEILVIEEKAPIIEDQLIKLLYNTKLKKKPVVIGKTDEFGKVLLPNVYELNPTIISLVIASRLKYNNTRVEFLKGKACTLHNVDLIRQPHYCSGCPHNKSTTVPEGSRAVGGIGCHYMATWMPDRNTHTFTQMGGEGVSWIGQTPFTTTKHVFQNLGDGTYFHSGILAIRQSLVSGSNITYKILHNDAVAMTGGQKVDGKLEIDTLINQLLSEGVTRIAVVSDEPNKIKSLVPTKKGITLDRRNNLDTIQRELRDITGTTILIYRQTCATEKRRRNKHVKPEITKRVYINPEICEGCGDCGKTSNCLSILPLETELGRKRKINQDACNKDMSCVDGFCPSFMTVEGKLSKVPDYSSNTIFPNTKLADIKGTYNIVFSGIGGTGVLTAAAILSMAAHLEDKGCTTLNQTGLAQKFGAVVSHVRISKNTKDIHAVKVSEGNADLVIGCDLLVSCMSDTLGKFDKTKTSAVINDDVHPTSEFIYNPDMNFNEEEHIQTLKDSCKKGMFLNATDICTGHLGTALHANMFLLGYAYQKSLLPVKQESIFEAIRLNGVDIKQNISAFTLGRNLAIDGMLKPIDKILVSIDDILTDRMERLEKYQNLDYANEYLTFVSSVIDRERNLLKSDDISKAVAKNLYKLMAYKDEYEIARLLTDVKHKDYKSVTNVTYHLAPPIFGKKKRAFGKNIEFLFPILAKMKFLRNTKFDIFGYFPERKMERSLIVEYKTVVTELLRTLNRQNKSTTLEIAELPDIIKGFGHVKDKNIEVYKEQMETLIKNRRVTKILFTEIK